MPNPFQTAADWDKWVAQGVDEKDRKARADLRAKALEGSFGQYPDKSSPPKTAQINVESAQEIIDFLSYCSQLFVQHGAPKLAKKADDLKNSIVIRELTKARNKNDPSNSPQT